MGAESATDTAPRSGGTGDGEAGGRAGQVLSGLAVALGLVLFLAGFGWGAVVYRPYTVPTRSMSPTIEAGDRVLAERVDGDEIRRGDVVVFKDAAWANAPLVKRVVGIGGDTVACCTDGRLTVNGKEIDEPYLPEGEAAESMAFPTVTVPKDRVFLLGDERAGSLDSTAHLQDAASGTVARSAIDGRIDAVVWPMDGLLPRPAGFEALGGELSEPGPFRMLVGMIVGGAVLVMAGAAYGPVAKRVGGARRRRTVDAGAG
ncbi:signal peptidase I [Streptomyces sp. NPDC005017]|uniref:signal peptidase I n=1 Tax=Streptomyces sp. NPDC005017 TaxID=3364706 RepID=UPI00368D5010